MASELRPVTIAPLNWKNYSAWSVQCRMALMRDGLWDIVSGSEDALRKKAAEYSKFMAKRDRALATMVLSINPSLLYLIGDPDDPSAVWEKLSDQFQMK